MDKTETIKKLLEGNQKYLTSEKGAGDISPRIRLKTAGEGQNPYAIIITCSDSRVIPEAIFSRVIPEAIFQCGIGDLFVIRLAGNVIDNHQLGSIEYAADHLGTKLIMVLGHTHCGAVDAAIHHDPEGYIKFITDEITKAIGEEKDPYKAACLNVQRSIDLIESSLIIQKDEEQGLAVVGAMYDIESGKVEIFT